jgi:hypothetical protein
VLINTGEDFTGHLSHPALHLNLRRVADTTEANTKGLGTWPVIVSATDASANTTSVTVNFVVNDTTHPAISVSATDSADADAGCVPSCFWRTRDSKLRFRRIIARA